MTVWRSWNLRTWLAWLMLVVLVVSLIVWYFTRDTLPNTIRIAAGPKGGLYYYFAAALRAALETQTGHPVIPQISEGSVENCTRLAAGEAELAIVQNGSVSLEGLAVVAPLYADVVHVIVRNGRGISKIPDLKGRRVVLGPRLSGNRESAITVLKHYDILPEDCSQTESYYGDLSHDDSLDAAIVTTGLRNPDLQDLLRDSRFALMPIPEAEALAIHHPYLSPLTIPRGFFAGNPPVPEQPVSTVSTTALLVVRRDASSRLVTKTMTALYEGDLPSRIPTLLLLKTVRDFSAAAMHPAAREYLDPYFQLGTLARLIDFLDTTRELLVALIAGIFLVWNRWRLSLERKDREAMQAQKERLDALLKETMAIEGAQMGTEDPERLREYMAAVTRIKLRALEELTHEALRGDRLFSIFLAQCATLTQKIQGRIMLHSKS